MIGLDLTWPHLAWVLLPVWGAVAWLWTTSRARTSPFRRRASLALRLVATGSLCLALAGMRLVRPVDGQCVLFLLDVSESVSPRAQQEALAAIRSAVGRLAPGDRAGLVVFGEDALLEESPTPHPRLDQVRSRLSRGATNVAAALRLAQATFPEGLARRIVLLTDGNENLERAADEVAQLAADGIDVLVSPIAPGGRRDVLVDRVVVPERVRAQEKFEVRVVLASTYDGQGTLKLYRDDVYLGQSNVTFKKGERAVHAFRDSVAPRGVHHYRAVLEPVGQDGPRANDAGEAFTVTEGRPAILYLHGGAQPSGPLLAALKESRFAVEVRRPEGMPGRLADLAACQAVILDNVDGPALGPERQKLLATYVRDLGGGLAMLGGHRSFGAGGYFGSPVEEVLPVTTDLSEKKRRPRVAMVVAVDKSGSMSAEEGGVQKIQLAAEGAVNVLRMTRPGDRFGVSATDTRVDWVVPLDEVGRESSGLTDAIRSLRAGGGGILVYTALRAAYDALDGDRSQVKHILLFADASDIDQPVGEAGEHVLDLAEKGLQKRITLSVVGLGRPGDKDVGLLEGLSRAGNGRFYLTDEASRLPQIFSQDASVMSRSVIVEGRVVPRPGVSSEITKGVTAPPALLGYVATSPRSAARTVLWASEDDPLLAHWNCGLGRSLAFTSDVNGGWSRDWISWPGYSKLVGQSMEWLAGQGARAEYPATVTLRDRRGTVTVDAVDAEGRFVDFLRFSAQVVAPGGGAGTRIELSQAGPGRYEGSFAARAEGVYLVNVQRDGDRGPLSSQIVGVAVPYSPEYRALEPNRPLLHEIANATGGRVVDDLSDVFRHDRRSATSPSDVWDWLVRLALVLFVVDVAIRKIALRAGAVRAMVEAVREPRPAPDDETIDHLERLKQRKRAAVRGPVPPAGSVTQSVSPAVPARAAGASPAPAETVAAPPAATGPGRPEGEPPGTHVSRLLEAKRRSSGRRSGPGRDGGDRG